MSSHSLHPDERPSKTPKTSPAPEASSSTSTPASTSAAHSSTSRLPTAPILKYPVTTERPGVWGHSGPPPAERGKILIPEYQAALWPDNGALLGSNTSYFPAPPPVNQVNTYIGTDGYWMEREYSQIPQPFDATAPHLAFFPVPSKPEDRKHLFFAPLHTRDVVPSPDPDAKGNLILDAKSSSMELIRAIEKLLKSYDLVTGLMANIRPLAPPVAKLRQHARLVLGGHDPNRALAAVKVTQLRLLSDGVKSYAEAILYWRALQRGALELIAYINFYALMTPHEPTQRAIQNHCWMLEFERRGVVLCGHDIGDFYHAYNKQGVPVYASLHRNYYEAPDEKIIRTSESRCSYDVDAKLSKCYTCIRVMGAWTYCNKRQHSASRSLCPTSQEWQLELV